MITSVEKQPINQKLSILYIQIQPIYQLAISQYQKKKGLDFKLALNAESINSTELQSLTY